MRLFKKGSEKKGRESDAPPNPYAQAPSNSNPYAQAPASDPYSQAKTNAYSNGPPASDYGSNSQDSGYGGGGYGSGGSNAGGYGANRYGAQSGYGGDRYGSSGTSGGGGRGGGGGGGGGTQAAPGGGSKYGSGGYGSMTANGIGGKTMSSRQQDDDSNRDALFGGAKDRVQKRQPGGNSSGGYGDPPPSYDEKNGPGGYGGSSQGGGYGDRSDYGDRQLTAEEEEEEDVKASKQQIRFMKQEDVSSTRNALRIAQQAEESGRDTLARLGAQGEHLHSTEKNLDLAHNQNRIAEEKARELKTLNKSMFAVHVSNPFTASSRREARDQEVIDKHLDAKEAREASRRTAYDSEQRMQKNFRDIGKAGEAGGPPKGRNLAERAKYQFEADSEDEEMENEIESNLDALGGAAGRLGALARATGREVDEQNKLLTEIDRKGDRVDLGLATNQARLDRISKKAS